MNQEEWDKYVKEEHKKLDWKLEVEKNRILKKEQEDSRFEKANQFLTAIRKGDLEKVQAFLQESKWNGQWDETIIYRINKAEPYDCGPVWKEKMTSVLTEAAAAKQIGIISYMIMQPKFHTNNVELLGKIGAVAMERGNDEVLKKVLDIRKKVPESHIIAAEQWKRKMAERGRG